MQKAILERFISKYSLTGAPERAKWESDGENVLVRFISEDQGLAGSVQARIQLPVGKFVVFEAAQLRSMLGALGEQIDVKLKTHKEQNVAFLISDETTKVTFALGDEKLALRVPIIVEAPEPAVVVMVDPAFTATFGRAATALHSDTVTIASDGAKATLTVGGSKDMNTNSITMKLNATCHTTLSPTQFSTNYLRAVLQANKDVGTGEIKLQKVGKSTMMTLSFHMDGFESKYLIGEMKNNG
jgi:hypothetical protein